MDKKKTTTDTAGKRSEYVSTERVGAVAANIFVGTTQDGLEYHYYKFSRAFKSAKQKDSSEFTYSDRFFPRNAEAIAKVAAQAAAKCEELDAELGSTEPAQEAQAA